MAVLNGKEIKRNVHLKTFNFWKENRFQNDVQQVSELLGISNRMAVYALNHGYVKFEDIHKITKFYESKLKESDNLNKDDIRKIKSLLGDKVHKKSIAKAFKTSVDAITILSKKKK